MTSKNSTGGLAGKLSLGYIPLLSIAPIIYAGLHNDKYKKILAGMLIVFSLIIIVMMAWWSGTKFDNVQFYWMVPGIAGAVLAYPIFLLTSYMSWYFAYQTYNS